MEMTASCQRRILGLPAQLIFIVYGLSGLTIALFSFAFQSTIDGLMSEQVIPPITAWLMNMPIFGWIVLFLLLGATSAWWFEKMERREGVVPRRAASLIAILGLLTVLFILVGLALPFLQGMGAIAAHR